MTVDKSSSVVSVAPDKSLVPVLVDYNVSQITPYVFVTAEDTARKYPTLFTNGITSVINVADELPQLVFPAQSGIESWKYPILDTPTFPASRYFDTVADRIATNVASNRRTLLYCHHGRSRSITFILAYLIKHHRLPLPVAYALVKEKRQIALPNSGFWSQLMAFDSYHQQLHNNNHHQQQQQQQQQYQYQRQQQHQYQHQHQHQRSHQQQLQIANPSPILKNVQDSLAYGQQVFTRFSTGVEKMLAHDGFINVLRDPKGSIYFRPIIPTHRVTGRRPSAFAPLHHHHFRLPPGIYIKRFF